MLAQTELGTQLRRRLLRVACMFLLLTTGPVSDGQCRVPYREGKVYENTAESRMMNISVSLADFAPNKLLCLAAELRHKFPNRRKLAIYIFSEYEAAKNYLPPGSEQTTPKSNWASKMHAIYMLDQDNREEYVELLPSPVFSGGTEEWNTRIDLPTQGLPKCNLQIEGRCLIEFRRIFYPYRDQTPLGSATITSLVTVEPSGAIRRVKVVQKKVNPATVAKLFADTTLENLYTWHFESRSHAASFRITFEFTPVQSSAIGKNTAMHFELPSRVLIETGLPKETP